jgi:hypothetical protein
MDPRTGLDDMENLKFLTPPHSNSDLSVVEPVARCYTDCATATLGEVCKCNKKMKNK